MLALVILCADLFVLWVVRNKMKQKFWELAGSKLGNILGVEKKSEEEDVDKSKLTDDGSVDYKNESQYSTHLQKKSEAVRLVTCKLSMILMLILMLNVEC